MGVLTWDTTVVAVACILIGQFLHGISTNNCWVFFKQNLRSSPVEERDEDEREKEDVDRVDREGEWVVVLEEVDVLVGLPTEDVGNHRIPQGDAWVGGWGQGEAGKVN